MYCKYCGKEVKPGQIFCKYCGKRLINDVKSTESSEDSAVTDIETVTDPVQEEYLEQKTPKADGGDTDNSGRVKAILSIIVIVVLLLLVSSIVSYLKTGSFNPISLFKQESREKDIESDTESNTDEIMSDQSEDKDPVISAGIEEEDNEEENSEEDKAETDLFAEFLAGNVTAIVADDFLSATHWAAELQPGYVYNIEELENYVIEDEYFSDDYFSLEKSLSEYAALRVHDGTMYALLIDYKLKDNEYGEGMNQTYVFYDNNGRLEIKFAIDEASFGTGPSTTTGYVCEEGAAFYGAHGGAGESTYSNIYAPDTNFSYKMISDEETHIGFDPNFYNPVDYTPMQPLNQIMETASAGNEEASLVRYYREIINGQEYYYYLSDDEMKITQAMVDYIDAIAAGLGFTFDGKMAADEAREAYERELGAFESCQNTEYPEWTIIGQ